MPGGRGGDGGEATCSSGIRAITGITQGGNIDGTSKAFGGFGAGGGTGCVSPPQAGGAGGTGGRARADQVNLTNGPPVEVLAVGGRGGMGAPGNGPGDPGEGGEAVARFELEAAANTTERDGERGSQGGMCPPGPMPDAGFPADSGNTGSGGSCSCASPGRTLTIVSGCDNFTDATMCSGWQSLIIGSENGSFTPEEEEEARTRVVADGTQFCAFGCCVRINCM